MIRIIDAHGHALEARPGESIELETSATDGCVTCWKGHVEFMMDRLFLMTDGSGEGATWLRGKLRVDAEPEVSR